MQEKLQKMIEYYETMEKVWTREIIEDCRELLSMISKDSKKETPRAKLVEFLRSKGVKSPHLFGDDKLNSLAKEYGYEEN